MLQTVGAADTGPDEEEFLQFVNELLGDQYFGAELEGTTGVFLVARYVQIVGGELVLLHPFRTNSLRGFTVATRHSDTRIPLTHLREGTELGFKLPTRKVAKS